jgi:hypothetical protein
MADRKRKVEQAIQESVDMSKAPAAPVAPAQPSSGPGPQEAKGIAKRIKKTKVARTREMLTSAATAQDLRVKGSDAVIRQNHTSDIEQRRTAAREALAAMPEPTPLEADTPFQRTQLNPRKRL